MAASQALFMASRTLATEAGLNVALVMALQHMAALSLQMVSPIRISIVCRLAGTPGRERDAYKAMLPVRRRNCRRAAHLFLPDRYSGSLSPHRTVHGLIAPFDRVRGERLLALDRRGDIEWKAVMTEPLITEEMARTFRARWEKQAG